MPEQLKASEVNSKTDPSVSKQWDTETPVDQQLQDLYRIIDKLQVGLLATHRPGVGIVSRSMAVAKRAGPDLLFLANAHSQKFRDLEHSRDVQVTFQNSSSQDWVSVSGTATTAANDDPRIKELYTTGTSAWFGDLGDGVHTGKPEDPRMALIEVRASYVAYWKAEVGTLGYLKEVATAVATGKVASPGVDRQLKGEDLEKARSLHKA